MATFIVEKRRLHPLRARNSWPSDDNAGVYRTTQSERSAENIPDYSNNKPGIKTLWLVTERVGDRLSMRRTSIYSAMERAIALCLVLAEQHRRFLLAKIICDCGKCEQATLRSIRGERAPIYCKAEFIDIKEARANVIASGLVV